MILNIFIHNKVLYHVVGLTLFDLGLQGLDLELGLLQLADTLTSCTLVLVKLALLLLHQSLQREEKTEIRSV